MDYPGEHLIPGQIGHFFLLLSLVSSLGAAFCYFLSVQTARSSYDIAGQSLSAQTMSAQWKKLARIFFFTEVISVFAVFSILFYIISNHLFEYKYAWQHSSRSLETKYLLSCFWEGQEGSFLLWAVWHCVLGSVIIWRQKNWEGPLMTVISFAQVLLATMILGVTFFGEKVGSNPFMLLRNSGVLDSAPLFHEASGAMRQDYLSLIKDGNDLNPLLQNYWMVIHPPVLFLGFASTIVPFGFAVAGLWTKKFGEWTKAALPWALFSAGILGLGIMMGAKWAYESLNFGGYWAWDPVENASLVPWLVLVAGIHTLVIYRHTGNALRTTYWFFILSFVLVLYSTYLTRSGDLQDTSVHAFTGDGITVWHLRVLLLIFALPSITLLIRRYKSIPYIVKEEETSSREFWMFVGSLVVFLSALLIIIMTSIPVINKLLALFVNDNQYFKPLARGENAAHSYNQIQIFVAIILALFTGFGMYLKYKSTGKAHLKKLLIPGVSGLAIAALILGFGNVNYGEQGYGFMVAIWIALAMAVFSAITNATYIVSGLKGSMKKAGGAIAHVGFALMLTGILISSSKKEVLSYNTSGIPVFFGKDSQEDPGENLTLIKGLRADMGKYWVTYDKDSAHPKKSLWFYHLLFESKDGKETFSLSPNAFVNYKGNMGLMANPDARHYFTHDIFTYITSLPDPSKNRDTSTFKPVTKKIGDTIFYSKGFMILEDLKTVKDIPNAGFGADDSASVATLKVMAQSKSIYTIRPILVNKGGQSYVQPDTLTAESIVLQLQKANGNVAELGIKESVPMQYVTLKAYKFPFIIVLWGGTVIMVLGFFISVVHRREKKKRILHKEQGIENVQSEKKKMVV
ncbi:MAG: cytochrome c biogenesis protein CcsA [Flavisolibacter sp.]